MKANPRRILAPILTLALPLSVVLVAGCSDRRVIPTPTPTPSPTPVVVVPKPKVDWREAEPTPGDWTWAMVAGKSEASFAGGLLKMRCDSPGGTISIMRQGSATAPVPMTIQTQYSTRAFNAAPGGDSLSVALPVRDPLLDAMAFTRGHFAVELTGLAPLYVPSWPEISRVIEDCR